ncbi:MAG TPA: AgmX/PglI C-terminal domain-containing protein [Kofleriaceae bacterium]|nr:AgmX/PglI C-terminal domain-containing protein [Kofleriaceae bacterium]
MLGAGMVLAATPSFADAPAKSKPAAKAKTAAKAKANKTPKAPAPSDHCAIDDLGFDSMLAKKSDAPAAPVAKKASVDTIAQSKAAADKFDLGRKSRNADRPGDGPDIKMQAKTLSAAAVGAVVSDNLGDLEYCLMQIPEKERGSEQFTLHLTIAAKGSVVEASVGGSDNADKIDECVQAQVKRWSFPQADAPTEIDYPVALHVQHMDN